MIVEEFIIKVREQLFSVNKEARESIIKELEGHIYEKANEIAKERNKELSEEIFKEVIEKLGNPKEIAEEYKKLCPIKLRGEKRRDTTIQLIIGIIAIIFGLQTLNYLFGVVKFDIWQITFDSLVIFSLLLIFGATLTYLTIFQFIYPAKFKELRRIIFVIFVITILILSGTFLLDMFNKIKLKEEKEMEPNYYSSILGFNVDSEGNAHLFYLDNRNYLIEDRDKYDLFYKKLDNNGNVIKDKMILKNFYSFGYYKYFDSAKGIVKFDKNNTPTLYYLGIDTSYLGDLYERSYYLKISEKESQKFHLDIENSINFDFNIESDGKLHIATIKSESFYEENYSQYSQEVFFTNYDSEGNLLKKFNLTLYKLYNFSFSIPYCLNYISVNSDNNHNFHIFNPILDNATKTISKINYTKVSKDGNVLLNKTIIDLQSNTSKFSWLNSVFYDNSIILFWQERDILFDINKLHFTKLDDNGTILFDKNFTEKIYEAEIVANKNIYLFYGSYEYYSLNLNYLKFDENGEILFKKETEITESGGIPYFNVAIDNKDNLHFVFQTYKGIQYVKYDGNGNEIKNLEIVFYKPKEKINWNKYLYNVILLDIIIIAIILIIIRFRIYKVKFIKIKYK